ncbi:MAG: hypothetical protein GY816_23815 [Cytophagales bacterium]|nr:hypothetical protein [Cytophagales bacterium]
MTAEAIINSSGLSQYNQLTNMITDKSSKEYQTSSTMEDQEPQVMFMTTGTLNDALSSTTEDISVSEAYSSTYWPGWRSWPDLTLKMPPPMQATRIRKWRSCSSLFLHSITIMAISYLLAPRTSQALFHNAPGPMLCQSSKAGTLWRPPKITRCYAAKGKSSSSTKLFTTTLRLFEKNLIKYESKAFHCRIIFHEIQTFTYLFANRRLKKDKTIEKSVGIEECKRMQKFKKCEHGRMELIDGMWQTSNKMNWDYPGGFFQCCTWIKFRATNCFLTETKVFKSHSDRTMDGLIGGVGHCNYHQGSCELSDGSALLWQPNNCMYELLRVKFYEYGSKLLKSSIEEVKESEEWKEIFRATAEFVADLVQNAYLT